MSSDAAPKKARPAWLACSTENNISRLVLVVWAVDVGVNADLGAWLHTDGHENLGIALWAATGVELLAMIACALSGAIARAGIAGNQSLHMLYGAYASSLALLVKAYLLFADTAEPDLFQGARMTRDLYGALWLGTVLSAFAVGLVLHVWRCNDLCWHLHPTTHRTLDWLFVMVACSAEVLSTALVLALLSAAWRADALIPFVVELVVMAIALGSATDSGGFYTSMALKGPLFERLALTGYVAEETARADAVRRVNIVRYAVYFTSVLTASEATPCADLLDADVSRGETPYDWATMPCVSNAGTVGYVLVCTMLASIVVMRLGGSIVLTRGFVKSNESGRVKFPLKAVATRGAAASAGAAGLESRV